MTPRLRARATLLLALLILVASSVSSASAHPASTRIRADLSLPVIVSAQDQGFWLDGETIATVWSLPVALLGPGSADSFSMTNSVGQPIEGTSVSVGATPNELDISLPLGAETPSEISYTGTGTTTVTDLAGDPAPASASPMAVTQSQPQFAGTNSDPFDQNQMLLFGQRSFYRQPWRSYMDTFPATRMLDAVGINFNVLSGQTWNVDAGAQLLHDAGFAHARISIPWNAMDYQHPNQISQGLLPYITNKLKQLKAAGVRPLILLDSDDQIPTPVQPVALKVTRLAPRWATQVQLDPTSARLVKPRLTGFSENGITAGAIITSVTSAGVATLSQPLFTAIPAGTYGERNLRFQPFFPEFNPDGSKNQTNLATLSGWLQYVAGVTQTAKSILGNDQFDVEVWNELTLGSHFLDASNYYYPAPQGSGSIPRELLTATVQYIRDPNNGLPDVGIGDGFASETPMVGGSNTVAGVTALDKHPYSGATEFPAQATFSGVRPVDALGNPAGTKTNGIWHDTFIPTFTSLFPEYFLNGIQTETVIHDLAPFTTKIVGVEHGRYTHPPGGPAPQVWVTEVNQDAAGVNQTLTSPDGSETSLMSLTDRRHFETKAVLRFLSAWVGKGATQIDFFAACCSGDLSLVDPNFWTAATQSHSYPGLAAAGETMLAVRRFLDTMSGAQDLTQTQPLSLDSISDYAGAAQFTGDGSANYPTLYNRDAVGFFPFQVTTHKWVIPTYVMTRDLATLYKPSAPDTDVTRQDMPQQVYRFTLGGVNPATLTASATDPLTGNSVPVKITGRNATAGTASLEMPLTDSPRMLTLQDG